LAGSIRTGPTLRLTYLLAAVLGIVQGLTEFLPISSTAHLLLVGQSLGFQDPGGVFTVMIQFGSVLAVMWLYRQKILDAFLGLGSNPVSRRFALMLIIASIPAGLAGLLLSDWVKGRLYQSPAVIASAFIIGGAAILMIERFRPKPVIFDADKTPVPRAFAVGLCQMLALVPGVSRSGAALTVARLRGLSRQASARLALRAALPVTVGAGLLKGTRAVQNGVPPELRGPVAVGAAAALGSALLALPLARGTRWRAVAAYRVLLGVAALRGARVPMA